MQGRCIGLDVHRDFCEVAIWEDGEVRRAPKLAARPEQLEEFARQLAPDDRVALEATSNALAIARIIKAHVAQVVIVNTRRLKAIAESKQKTDRHDAKTLAQLLAAGMLSGSWQPDETIRALRRRVARRARLVSYRARFKNEILAVLHRNLKNRPPMTDPFGVAGRQWLSKQTLAEDERDTLDAALRQIDFPLRAFFERVRARRGHAVAIVAVARKMCVLFWQLLTRGEDYAYQMPIVTAKKLRKVELIAGAPRRRATGNLQGPNREERR